MAMAAPSISMAAASTATASVRLSPRNIKFSLDFSSSTLQPKFVQIKPKFVTLKTHLYVLKNSLHCHDSTSTFDNSKDPGSEFEEEEDEEEEEEEEDYDYMDDEDEELESQQSEGSRLYVGNLPYSMTSAELKEVFGEAGRVAAAEIVYDRVTDRSRGFAFVTMGSVGDAKKAIRTFDGAQIGGRTVKVNFPEVPRGGERQVMGPQIRRSNWGFIDSPHKIYAGNLAWTITSEGLKEVFANQPGLLGARVIYDRDSGKARGFGFITFSSDEDAQSAIDAMNGLMLEGRPLRLNLATERAKNISSQVEETSSERETDIQENALESTISM